MPFGHPGCCCKPKSACCDERGFCLAHYLDNPNKYDWAFLYCNVNAVTDDNVSISLGGQLLGEIDMSQDNVINGAWFATSRGIINDITTALTDVQGIDAECPAEFPSRDDGQNCCESQHVVVNIVEKDIFAFCDSVEMDTVVTQNNGSGNYGKRWMWRKEKKGNKSYLCNIFHKTYNRPHPIDVTQDCDCSEYPEYNNE